MQCQVDQVDREIESMEQLLSQTPDDPNRIHLLIYLAKAHDKRFDLRREPQDIQKVIEYRSIVLALVPDGNLGLPCLLSELGFAHEKRFKRLGDTDDMENAIKHKSLALQIIPDDHPDLPRQLTNLAVSYKHRFKRLGNPRDIEQAIECDLRAVAIIPKDHPLLSALLEGLGMSHSYRFERFGDLKDLESAMEYQSRALVLTPDDHPDLSNRLANLGVSHKERFRRLALTPDGHPDLSSRLANLATSHNHRFKRLGELNDLEQDIEYELRALALTPDDHPYFSTRLANLGLTLKDRFQRLGDLRDLEQAVEYELRALALTPDDHPDLSSRLGVLAESHNIRFHRLGELSDLEQAINYQSRALAMDIGDNPKLSIYLNTLAVSHSSRFKLLGEMNDLEQAIKYQSRALTEAPDGHPNIPAQLGNLGVHHSDRFERLGELIDLEQAIVYESRALALTPDDHPHSLTYLSNLAVSHSYRFKLLGKLSDLEQAIEYESRALALTPNDDPKLLARLGNLAVSHKDRFGYLGGLIDLEQAIKYESRAIAEITYDHPDACLWYSNHAISYVFYYDHSLDLSHLEQSLALFRRACMSPTGLPRSRFGIARCWASYASKHIMLNPIEAYQATMNLLPEVVWLGATSGQRYQDLKSIRNLAADAARAAIISSNYPLALEWLEYARCVVWSQNLMLRSPLNHLLASHPSLATRLQTAAAMLHAASLTSRESQALSHSTTSEQVAQDHRRIAKEYEELLAQARTQPGFEDLLRPMKAAGLMHAARSGPIVVINCYEDASDALCAIADQDTVNYLSLPSFSVKKAQDAHSAIRSSLQRKGIRERGFCVMQEPAYKEEFESVLKVLWTDVVKPILEFLGYTTHTSGNHLPHITWCPTGAASFLPFHAAGDYDQPHSRVFDYVVSSYTPTLTALLDSTPSQLNCNSRVLAIGQAATPNHTPLPGIITELKHVKSHIESRARYSELIDAQATPATVLDAMEKHDWVHLACHAHQNVYDPTKSGFFLHGGILDLAEINRRSFSKKGLAFLSACQTATGDETLPDEAVHLASGMLMAGYSSVIATMWSVGDSDAPLVADKLYSELMKKGTLGNGEAGRALHDAVGELRSSIGEKEFGRWVPFIHIGS